MRATTALVAIGLGFSCLASAAAQQAEMRAARAGAAAQVVEPMTRSNLRAKFDGPTISLAKPEMSGRLAQQAANPRTLQAQADAAKPPAELSSRLSGAGAGGKSFRALSPGAPTPETYKAQ
jgi:hypothetical protein